jgi:hypothetical protein
MSEDKGERKRIDEEYIKRCGSYRQSNSSSSRKMRLCRRIGLISASVK